MDLVGAYEPSRGSWGLMSWLMGRTNNVKSGVTLPFKSALADCAVSRLHMSARDGSVFGSQFEISFSSLQGSSPARLGTIICWVGRHIANTR